MDYYPFDINNVPTDATHYAGHPNGGPELVFYKMVKGKWRFTYPNETTWLSCRKGLTSYPPIKILYRIKPKSERELFIDGAVSCLSTSSSITPQQMAIAACQMFDSGDFKYKDLTQHFGENI